MAKKPLPQGAPRKTAPRKPLDSWDREARRLLQLEMLKNEHTPASVAKLLDVLGYDTASPKLIAERISRGSFNLGFTLRVLRVMGLNSIDISHVKLHKRKKATD